MSYYQIPLKFLPLLLFFFFHQPLWVQSKVWLKRFAQLGYSNVHRWGVLDKVSGSFFTGRIHCLDPFLQNGSNVLTLFYRTDPMSWPFFTRWILCPDPFLQDGSSVRIHFLHEGSRVRIYFLQDWYNVKIHFGHEGPCIRIYFGQRNKWCVDYFLCLKTWYYDRIIWLKRTLIHINYLLG